MEKETKGERMMILIQQIMTCLHHCLLDRKDIFAKVKDRLATSRLLCVQLSVLGKSLRRTRGTRDALSTVAANVKLLASVSIYKYLLN